MSKKSKKSLTGDAQPTRTTSEPESYGSYVTRKTQCTGDQKPVHNIQSGMNVEEWNDGGHYRNEQLVYHQWLNGVKMRTNIENNCVCVKDKQCKTKYCEKKGKDYGKCSVRRDNRSFSHRISSGFKSLLSSHGRKKKKKSKKGKKKK